MVLTVGEFHAGSARNVIPDTAAFHGSVRCFSADVEARLGVELPQIITRYAEAHQMSAEATFTPVMPATVNDEAESDYWQRTAAALYGENRFQPLPHPKTGSEDFSRILQEIPGSFGHLGAGSPDIDPVDWAPLHSARAQFDDRILPDQALFLASLAFHRLQDRPTMPLDRGRAVVLASGAPATLVRTLPWYTGPHKETVEASIKKYSPQPEPAPVPVPAALPLTPGSRATEAVTHGR